jgi:hypothetical protein
LSSVAEPVDVGVLKWSCGELGSCMMPVPLTVAGVERALLLPLRDPPLVLLGLAMSLMVVGVDGLVTLATDLVGESVAGVLLAS